MDKWTILARGLSWWILGLMSTSQRTCDWHHHERKLSFYFFFICVKTMCFNNRDVQTMWWYSSFICQLMCDWSLDAHKVMHSILSLKIGVTIMDSLLQFWIFFPLEQVSVDHGHLWVRSVHTFDKHYESVVIVRNRSKTLDKPLLGTDFIIHSTHTSCLILTCQHILKNFEHILCVRFIKKQSGHDIKVVYGNKMVDLVIIEV
jgi:hypothetical protein